MPMTSRIWMTNSLVTFVLFVCQPDIRLIAQSPQPQTSADDRGTLVWYARQAIKDRESAISISFPLSTAVAPVTLERALKGTALVVAEPLATATTHLEREITTWTKYKIVETMASQPPLSEGPAPVGVPPCLLPINAGEFVLPRPGGTVVIDGVTITEQDPNLHVPPDDQPHLMFVLFKYSGQIAFLNYGTDGLLWMDRSQQLHAVTDGSLLARQVLQRSGGNLPALRVLASEIANKPGQ
jgi:hypothetical protein